MDCKYFIWIKAEFLLMKYFLWLAGFGDFFFSHGALNFSPPYRFVHHIKPTSRSSLALGFNHPVLPKKLRINAHMCLGQSTKYPCSYTLCSIRWWEEGPTMMLAALYCQKKNREGWHRFPSQCIFSLWLEEAD